jgi:hypothetical protein
VRSHGAHKPRDGPASIPHDNSEEKNVYILYTLVSWSLSGFLKFNTIQILLTYSKRFHQEISNMVIT